MLVKNDLSSQHTFFFFFKCPFSRIVFSSLLETLFRVLILVFVAL